MHFSKHAAIALGGTALQWYDASLLGYLAPLIATLFFPQTNPTTALLDTFGLLAASSVISPLGAVLFGYIGDNFGRKKALAFSILGIAIPSSLISILPTYAQVGLSASIFLSLFRIIQSLVASAEYTGSAIYLVEHARENKKFFYGCFTSAAYSIGSTVAALLTSLVTLSCMPNWAWRIPFALALIGGLFIYRLRRHFAETPIFNALQPVTNKRTFFTALKQHPQAVFCTAFLGFFVGIITVSSYIYSTTYLHLYSKLPLSLAILFTSAALMVDAMLEPFLAHWADKWCGRKIISLGFLGLILFAFPIFHCLASGKLLPIIGGLILLSSLTAFVCAPLNTLLIHLFSPECRFSGFSVAFNVSGAACGAVPFLMTWLISRSQNILMPAAVLVLTGGFGLIALYLTVPLAVKTRGHALSLC